MALVRAAIRRADAAALLPLPQEAENPRVGAGGHHGGGLGRHRAVPGGIRLFAGNIHEPLLQRRHPHLLPPFLYHYPGAVCQALFRLPDVVQSDDRKHRRVAVCYAAAGRQPAGGQYRHACLLFFDLPLHLPLPAPGAGAGDGCGRPQSLENRLGAHGAVLSRRGGGDAGHAQRPAGELCADPNAGGALMRRLLHHPGDLSAVRPRTGGERGSPGARAGFGGHEGGFLT